MERVPSTTFPAAAAVEHAPAAGHGTAATVAGLLGQLDVLADQQLELGLSEMSGRGRKSTDHASGSNSDVSDNHFTAMLQAFIDSQKTQVEQQANVSEDNTEFR
ncbi:hypothetical protein MRB53_030447 [Persea americana]|uniref:Uncharacterized protein n=1 Tax=Persea americana TaxID=3435 RepID=A0ACC2KLL5_PERAE|nr:hypothetical protein MRB53_030447 [Persea americana]